MVSVGNTQTVITRHTVNPQQNGRLMLELDLDPGGYLFSATSEDGRQAVLYLVWNTMSRTDSLDLVLEQLR